MAMKWRYLGLILVSLASAGAARADFTGPNPQIGLFGGIQTGNDEIKSGPAMFGAVGVRLSPYVAFDIQGGWAPADSKHNRLAGDDITVTSLEFVPRLYAPMGRFQPYLAAGAGRFFFGEQSISPPGSASSISETINAQWGGIFGGGLDFVLNENVSVGLDLAYIYLRTSSDATVHTSASVPGLIFTTHQSLNLDMVRVLAGLRVKFNPPGWSNVYQ
jgi:opacity protein-like surface antigen